MMRHNPRKTRMGGTKQKHTIYMYLYIVQHIQNIYALYKHIKKILHESESKDK